MKVLFDIGHPGHVHYFKFLIKELKANGHQVIVSARERDIIFTLLKFYNIQYINRGNGSNSRFGKLIYMLKADFFLLKKCFKSKPDLFISFSSPYAAQTAYLLNRPHIAVNDTEHTDAIHSTFTYRFSKWVVTPQSYQNNLGKKHIRFNNIMEGIYLNSKVFNPDDSIYKDLGIPIGKPFIFMRFVSWNAHHDFGHSGLSLETKRELINILSPKFQVYISSEGVLPQEFKQYEISISPEKMHSVLHYASMFIGESGTMASESAYLGTPTVYINSLPLMCYLKLEQEHNLLKHFKNSEGVTTYVRSLIEKKELKAKTVQNALKMRKSFNNANTFFNNLVLNYPESINTFKT